MGSERIPWQFEIVSWPVLFVTALFKQGTRKIEDRLLDLWDRQGLSPPAELLLAFRKTRWQYEPLGCALLIPLVLFAVLFLRQIVREDLELLCALPILAFGAGIASLLYVTTLRRRIWWLWLLASQGEETVEFRWTWRLAKRLGLPGNLVESASLFWKNAPADGAQQ